MGLLTVGHTDNVFPSLLEVMIAEIRGDAGDILADFIAAKGHGGSVHNRVGARDRLYGSHSGGHGKPAGPGELGR